MVGRLIPVNGEIFIRQDDIHLDYIHASGPGGQNVNKVSSAVQLRFNTRTSSLPEEVRGRLARQAANRINEEGVLVIEANRFRTQEHNRQDAIQRLVQLVRRAAEKPKLRRKTRPTAASQHRRLAEKRRRAEIKRIRRMNSSSE